MSRRPKLPNRSTTLAPELARATQAALDTVPDQRVYVTEPQHYTEPMHLALGDDDRVPRVVQLVRVVALEDPELAVSFGNCSWTSAANAQVKIIDVPGMTADTTLYQFTFLVMW